MAKQFTHLTTLPYVHAAGSGAADRLLVTFPKLHPGPVPPKAQLYGDLAAVDAHRLSIGADEHTFVGPRRERRGFGTAVKLIAREARARGVAREHVVTLGSSMGAVCSLFVGLRAGAGWIIAGAPPVRMGSMLRRLADVDGATDAATGKAEGLLAVADDGSGLEDAARYLDEMILRLARRAAVPTRIDLFVSRRDVAYHDVLWFADQAKDLPLVDVRVTIGEYGKHRDIPGEFHAFALELLMAACGPAQRGQATQKSFSRPTENGHPTTGSAAM